MCIPKIENRHQLSRDFIYILRLCTQVRPCTQDFLHSPSSRKNVSERWHFPRSTKIVNSPCTGKRLKFRCKFRVAVLKFLRSTVRNERMPGHLWNALDPYSILYIIHTFICFFFFTQIKNSSKITFRDTNYLFPRAFLKCFSSFSNCNQYLLLTLYSESHIFFV